jgi:hypothetical protein
MHACRLMVTGGTRNHTTRVFLTPNFLSEHREDGSLKKSKINLNMHGRCFS